MTGVEEGGLCSALGLRRPSSTGRYLAPWICGEAGADAPWLLQFVDIDLDGNLDVVSTDGDEPVVAIAFGDGTGHFSTAPYLSSDCGFATRQAAVADLNGDGIPDIVATVLIDGSGPGCIAIFLGQGGGQFAPAQEIDSGGINPFSIAVGDMNNDGIPDLVVVNTGNPEQGVYGSLAVLLGKGDGTFRQPIIYSSGIYEFTDAIVGDFNRDGKLDVAVVANGVNGVIVYPGKGNGALSSPKVYPAGEVPWFVVTADFNGDGIPDLAVGNYTNPKPCYVSVILGNGDGSFQPPVHFRVGVSPLQLITADFNGDGKPDIATVNGGDSTISILLNTTPWPAKSK